LSALSALGFTGPAEAALRARAVARLVLGGQEVQHDMLLGDLFRASRSVRLDPNLSKLQANFLAFTADPAGATRWRAGCQVAINDIDQCLGSWLPIILVGPTMDDRFVVALEQLAKIRMLFWQISEAAAQRQFGDIDLGAKLRELLDLSFQVAEDLDFARVGIDPATQQLRSQIPPSLWSKITAWLASMRR
jgi:hypothetical protein